MNNYDKLVHEIKIYIGYKDKTCKSCMYFKAANSNNLHDRCKVAGIVEFTVSEVGICERHCGPELVTGPEKSKLSKLNIT